MCNKILSDINNFLEFINEYKNISEVSEISFNIGRILNLLNSQRFHDCDVLCNQIVNSTDFENVKIRPVDKRNMTVIQRIKSNAFYLIERLTMLAFNKISKHELCKGIEVENKSLSVIYNLLESELKNKKGYLS